MNVSLFLGAGASVPFGMPTTKDFKDKFIDEHSQNPTIQELLKIAAFEDIEHILRAIDDVESVGEYGGHLLDYIKKREQSHGERILMDLDILKNEIHKYVYDFYSFSDCIDLDKYTWIFDILKSNANVIDIFTTNYDQIVEKYVRSQNDSMSLHDGFVYDDSSDKHKFSPNNFVTDSKNGKIAVNVYKLHGSLNWKKDSNDIIRNDFEQQLPNESQNLLIYPTLDPKNGLDEEPYTSINKKFENQIHKTDVFVVIGYSFRDSHINTVFSDFLGLGKTLIVISPTASKDIGSYDNFKHISTINIEAITPILLPVAQLRHARKDLTDKEKKYQDMVNQYCHEVEHPLLDNADLAYNNAKKHYDVIEKTYRSNIDSETLKKIHNKLGQRINIFTIDISCQAKLTKYMIEELLLI